MVRGERHAGTRWARDPVTGKSMTVPADMTYSQWYEKYVEKNGGVIRGARGVDEPAYGTEKTVTVHIRNIREKIEINPKEPKYLKVVYGLGYKVEKC